MSVMYCQYKEKIYLADLDENLVEITSDVKENGFIPYTDILGNVHTDIFVKNLDVHDVELLFEQNIFIKYCGKYFETFAGKITKDVLQEEKIMIFTSSECIAKEMNFNKKEQFVFIKDIKLEDIEEIKIVNRPISIFADRERKETRIEKKDIRKWLFDAI